MKTDYLVIDLEATCSNDNSIPRGEMETIEIGAARVDKDSYEILQEFSCLVDPILNDVNEFCENLTGIKQEWLDDAPLFLSAMEELKGWIWDFDRKIIFCSWGKYDWYQIKRDYERHGEEFKENNNLYNHIDLKSEFAKKNNCKRMGLKRALKKCGLEFTGNHHRALDDVRNIVKLLPYCF